MIQVDRRMAGEHTYILTDEVIPLMIIPREVRNCVVYVGCRKYDGNFAIFGTGFFLTRHSDINSPAYTYLVTAKHVLDEIEKKHIQTETEIWLWVRLRDGQTKWIKTLLAQWIQHPDKTVDVAALGVSDFEGFFDHVSYPLYICLSPDDLFEMRMGVGHEVFITGLFLKHTGKRSLIPIVRVGNIAAMPEERIITEFSPIEGVEGYLIEARSTSGLSGSPVFIAHEASQRLEKIVETLIDHVRNEAMARDLSRNFEDFKNRSNNYYYFNQPTLYLLGIAHAHFDGENINTGIAVVTPASKILEVLDQPMVKKREQELEEKKHKGEAATLDSLVTDETVEGDSDEYAVFTEDDFERALRKVSRPKQRSPDKEKPETSE